MKKLIMQEMERTRESLIRAMEVLGQDLVRKAKRLKENKDYCINSLGEIQGQGPMIDAYCGAFATLRNLLHDLEGLEKK